MPSAAQPNAPCRVCNDATSLTPLCRPPEKTYRNIHAMLLAVLPLLASLGTVAVSQQQITGYYQLTNDGATGPCRGTTPDDNDRSAYGTNLLATDTTDCTSCAALCSANVNITGYPRECIAFECTPSTSDNVVGYESARFGRLRQREKYLKQMAR